MWYATKQEFKYAVDDTKFDAHDYSKLIPTLQAEFESRKCHQLLSCELGGLFHQLGLELVDLVTEIAVTHNLSEQKESFEKRCNSYMQKQAFYAQREAEINNPRAAAAGESMGEWICKECYIIIVGQGYLDRKCNAEGEVKRHIVNAPPLT